MKKAKQGAAVQEAAVQEAAVQEAAVPITPARLEDLAARTAAARSAREATAGAAFHALARDVADDARDDPAGIDLALAGCGRTPADLAGAVAQVLDRRKARADLDAARAAGDAAAAADAERKLLGSCPDFDLAARHLKAAAALGQAEADRDRLARDAARFGGADAETSAADAARRRDALAERLAAIRAKMLEP